MSVLLTVFVVFPVVAAYRGTDASYNSAVQSSASSAANSISGLSPRQLLSTGTSETFSRFSDALSVGVVLDESYVDRKRVGGSPIDYVVSSAVPRFIWPSKPNPGTYGNEFGRAYGLIAQKDYVTSISVSQPLHAYMFGGWILLILFVSFQVSCMVFSNAYCQVGAILSSKQCMPTMPSVLPRASARSGRSASWGCVRICYSVSLFCGPRQCSPGGCRGAASIAGLCTEVPDGEESDNSRRGWTGARDRRARGTVWMGPSGLRRRQPQRELDSGRGRNAA